MSNSLSFGPVRSQVDAIRKKVDDAQVVGLRTDRRWTLDRHQRHDDRVYLVHQCDSPLAMRMALRDPDAVGAITVLVTGLDEADLSDDIRVRLARRQLFALDPWQTLRSQTGATAIDPRLLRHRWIAEALIELPDTEHQLLASRARFLDAEAVWPLLLRTRIGLTDARPDLTSILRWSTEAAAGSRFRGESRPFRDGARAWLTELAGAAADAVLNVVETQDRPDAVPMGLAMGVIYHTQPAGQLDRAAGRFEERYLGGRAPDPKQVQRWSTAASEVVRLQVSDPRLKRSLLERTDALLAEVGADAFAELSPTSPLGFRQLLVRFGTTLSGSLAQRGPALIEPLACLRQQVADHDQASRERPRLDSLDMAIRLVRWLQARAAVPTRPAAGSLVDAAREHTQDASFVDWARLSLRQGDPVGELSEAYSRLIDRVTAEREDQARHFAGRLAEWTQSDHQSEALCPVERVLDRIVAPLARHGHVLLIVMDGMSTAVCRELLASVVGHDWLVLSQDAHAGPIRSGLAAIPSVTEVSRTSLLCGQLKAGSADDEKVGFAEHPALKAVSQGSRSPVLFHKRLLSTALDASLASNVREAIQDPTHRVVGVVVNAVDDLLAKGDQLEYRWSRDSIPILTTLLSEAKAARRLVVLTSDHGHVIDRKAHQEQHDGGERWRTASSPPAEHEVQLGGRRVVKPESRVLVVPWTEAVYYGVKKHGYHGGANPQEMVTPIVVLSPTEELPAGWVESGPDTPPWWDGDTTVLQSPDQAAPKPPGPTQGTLFETVEPPVEVPVRTPTPAPDPAWVEALFRSPQFVEQRRCPGPGQLADDRIRAILRALDQRGGRATTVALARALENMPPMRISGMIALLQRVLNFDGFAVLTRDEASDTIELNWDLLNLQFGLERARP